MSIKKEKPDRKYNDIQVNYVRKNDLTSFTNDRVQLLQQVFTILNSKDIAAIAPHSIRNAPMSSIQELCLEELLGISSKRLLAILKGKEPPSNTESSSEESLSLDSISSSESLLDNHHKKRKKGKKKKNKGKKSSNKEKDETIKSKTAERAGMTVLELLELQARARAIRAQLNVEKHIVGEQEVNQKNNASNTDEDDVLIKEEPAEVVELSSDEDQKPDISKLEAEVKQITTTESTTQDTNDTDTSQIVAHRNNLTIILPKAPTTRKIKLKRDTNLTNHLNENISIKNKISCNESKSLDNKNEGFINIGEHSKEFESPKAATNTSKSLPGSKNNTEETNINKTSTKENKNNSDKTIAYSTLSTIESSSQEIIYEASAIDNEDRDEITLQISDSEQMDLLGCENDLIESDKNEVQSKTKNLDKRHK